MTQTFRFEALQLIQRSVEGHPCTVYAVKIQGSTISKIATVSRVRREEGLIVGYQRPEALAHIAGIREYLESPSAMLPNAIVISFRHGVRFEATGESFGHLVVEVPDDATEEELPGFIVDGQQRVGALRGAELADFPVIVGAFVSSDPRLERQQFIVVNNTKPVAKALLYELLPGTMGALPAGLERRREPAALLAELNARPGALCGTIATTTNPDGRIKDTSMLCVLEDLLRDGALFDYCGDSTSDGALALLTTFFDAVAEVWPAAWALGPKKSRLTHGAGIIALGALLNTIWHAHPEADKVGFVDELQKLVPLCAWTSGEWDLGATKRPWNGFQNTKQDIGRLADFLVTSYRARAATTAPARAKTSRRAK